MKSYASVLFLVLPLVGCGGGASDQARANTSIESSEESWPSHPYFPMTPGTLWIYEGEEDGLPLREEIRTLEETEIIWGTVCAVMNERVFIDNQLTEVTSEWFGLDAEGNVWKFGEETLELVDGKLRRADDSWITGVGDALPWIVFAANPQVGDVYSGYRPGGVDVLEVVSVTTTATVPAGTFENCLELVENREDPLYTDIILYAPGVGRISERNASGNLELKSTRRKFTGSQTRSTKVLWVPPVGRASSSRPGGLPRR